MHRKDMSKDPKFVIEQLEEALEERQGNDRRKTDDGADPISGADRRKIDRRKVSQNSRYH